MEYTILSHLLFNEPYARKVLPFLKEEYFQNNADKTIFKIVHNYVEKYNNLPTKEVLKIELTSLPITQQQFNDSTKVINDLAPEETDINWLVDNTEKFCQDKSVYNAIMESINIIDGKSKDKDKGALPQILSDALSVSFDQSVGHDFLADADSRYEFYHRVEEKLPFDLDFMNKITNGGLTRKTLTVIMASTGGGKSLFMCHGAAANLTLGKNVLYITLEMSEERIAERIDANLMNTTTADLVLLPKDVYDKKIDRIKRNTTGKLIIKEYPTATGSASHFRYLLNELRIKKNFTPDVIYIDYINICASSRVKMGASVNTYVIVKAIAEELRGLAAEFDVPIVTATQVNRGGMNSSDVELTDTSESVGLPQTADLMLALIATEELDHLGQIMVKQLKNRYNDPAMHRRFVLGIDRAKMKLFDVEQSAQDGLMKEDKPVFDNGGFGEGMDAEKKAKFKKLFV